MNMDREFDGISRMISDYNMSEKLGMPAEKLEKMLRKAVTANHLAFVLADAANSLLIDCESIMKRMGVPLSGNDKYNFKKMLECLKGARKWAREASLPMYDNNYEGRADNLNDSDWWYSFAKAVEDKVGGSRENTSKLIGFILEMQGKNVFDVSESDFEDSL